MQLLASAATGPFISAHRGYSTAAPENTIAALEAARLAGATVAEIDVRPSADGALVLMHDATVDRTTNGSGPVGALSLSELRRLDAGRWFDRKFAGTPVPTLQEALRWSQGRLGLLVELKNFPERDPAVIEEVIAVILAEGAEDYAVVGGFDHPTLAELHRRQPGWPLEMMVHARLADPVAAALSCGATLISLEPEFCVADDVAALHRAGIAVLTTVLSEAHGRELAAMGVDFFENDDVLLCRRAIAAPLAAVRVG